MGRREEAKDERRARIVASARQLMRQHDVDKLSMKQIAHGADVSLSTVYNLFESREDVLAHVFNEAFVQYKEMVEERASREPVQRFLDAVDIAAEIYSRDVPFYRTSIWLVDADSSYKLSLQKPRFGFFRDLINHALAGGALRKDVDVYVLGLMIVPMFSAAYQAWAGGWVSIEEFRARAKLGICIVLEGYADGPHQEKLRGLLPSLEADVRDQRQKSAGRRPPD